MSMVKIWEHQVPLFKAEYLLFKFFFFSRFSFAGYLYEFKWATLNILSSFFHNLNVKATKIVKYMFHLVSICASEDLLDHLSSHWHLDKWKIGPENGAGGLQSPSTLHNCSLESWP